MPGYIAGEVSDAEEGEIEDALEEAKREWRKLRPMPERGNYDWDDEEDDSPGKLAPKKWKLRPLKAKAEDTDISVLTAQLLCSR